MKFLLAFTYGLKKINLASCCATHIGIKYLDYILSSYWSLPYSPKQGADICYEADCYTENNIIGDKEYDSDKQNSNTSREEHDKKNQNFGKPARLYAFQVNFDFMETLILVKFR